MLNPSHSAKMTLRVVAVLLVSGCASNPPLLLEMDRPLADAKADDRLVMMKHELRRKESEMEKLAAKFEATRGGDLKTLRNGAGHGNDAPGSRSDRGAAAVAAKLPVVKLLPGTPSATETDEVDPLESVLGASQTIADSRDEAMPSYFQGLDAVAEKKFELAVRHFRAFLAVAPEHVYADRAGYLLAQSHFDAGEPNLAVIAINRVLARHPNSFRAEDGYVLRSRALEAMGHREDAISALRELLRRYPRGERADFASRELGRLSVEATRKAQPELPPNGGA